MEPGSRADNLPEHSSHALANFIGTLIALLTLTVPAVAIAHFSSSNIGWPPPNLLEQTNGD